MISSYWTVELNHSARKGKDKLPKNVIKSLSLLLEELKLFGPVRSDWKNYQRLSEISYHCHIKSGRPTYVVCWTANKKTRQIEVYYVGTHENAPY